MEPAQADKQTTADGKGQASLTTHANSPARNERRADVCALATALLEVLSWSRNNCRCGVHLAFRSVPEPLNANLLAVLQQQQELAPHTHLQQALGR